MRIYTLAAALALMLGHNAAHALEGCYVGDTPHNGGTYDSIRYNVEFPILDIYIAAEVFDLEYPYLLDPDVALAEIRRWVQEIQPQLGASFRIRYRGSTSTLGCCSYASRNNAGCGNFTTPTLIISVAGGSEATGGSQQTPNGDMFCGEINIPDLTPSVCNYTTFPFTGCANGFTCASGLCREAARLRKFRFSLWHELMHVLRYEHQDDAMCASAWQNDASVVLKTWGSNDIFERPTMADIRNTRSAYGTAKHDAVRRLANGLTSDAWGSEYVIEANTAISEVAATDGNTHAEGYAFLARNGSGLDGRVRAVVYESGSWAAYWPSIYETYHRPAIARSRDQATNLWLVGFWEGETREAPEAKTLYFRQKEFGSSSWVAGGSLSVGSDGRLNDGLGLGYDPISDRFLVAWLTDDFKIAVASRTVASITWSSAYESTGSQRYWGDLDVACSPSNVSEIDANCMVTTFSKGSAIEYSLAETRWFTVTGGGAITFKSTATLLLTPEEALHSSPVMTAANPNASDPRAVIGYAINVLDGSDSREDQFWQAELVVDPEASFPIFWSTLEPTDDTGEFWFRGPGLGAHIYSSSVYKQLAYARY
jgi:hypothetical protein